MKSTKEESSRSDITLIDAALSQMGKDEQYLRATGDVSRDFAQNDAEALQFEAPR